MTAACIITALCIFIAGLFAVIVERTNERDAARDDNVHLAAELDQALGRLAEALNEIPPLELVPFDSLSKPERDHIKAAASKITAASLRPDLRIVEPAPVADESWLDEITRPGGWGDGSAS